MRFDGLDLNLLVALDALIEEQNVSVAAERLHLSQGAMSAALGRLRDYFKDELLVSVGRRMVLTPRAEDLAMPVRNVLLQVRSNITTQRHFDPALSDRQIRLICSDYFLRVGLAKALASIAASAPYMTFDLGGLEEDPTESLHRGGVDLVITIDAFISPEHPSKLLFEDDFVVVGWKHSPLFDRPLGVDTFWSAGQVAVSHGSKKVMSFAETALRQLQNARRVEVVAPGFSAVPYLLVGTNRISIMHRRLAELMCETLDLVCQPVPFDFPAVKIMVQWNTMQADDEALNWVIDQITASV